MATHSNSMAPRSLNVDLHCHSTASDGDLSPDQVVERAIEQGVDVLAITDHDNVDGYEDAAKAAHGKIRLITGIEFSSVWKGIGIHIVGLNFEPDRLHPAVLRQKTARETRTLKIAQRLEKKGVVKALEGAKRFATGDTIGRPHFAKYLVAAGHFATEADAFKQWLSKSKIGDVKTSWPDINTVVSEIHQAGGVAVLAHPHHYKLTNRKLNTLLQEFKDCGGDALEVCVSGMKPEQTAYFASLCQRHQLMASRGSDFHTPSNQWVELGRVAALPDTVIPVWRMFT